MELSVIDKRKRKRQKPWLDKILTEDLTEKECRI